jgi:DNA mismatch repair protein MutS
MRVKEWQGRVVFLHEVAKGAAGRSWGVHVAGLAGVPAPVVRRAGVLLHALEKTSTLTAAASLPLFAAAEPQRNKSAEPQKDKSAEPQRDEFAGPPQEPTATEDDPIHRALADIDPDQLSPREALEIIYRLQALLRAATPHETLS